MPRLITPDTLLPPPLRVLADGQSGLLHADQCRRHGLSQVQVRHRVLAHGWVRVARGVFDVRPGESASWDDARRRAAWRGLLTYGPGAVAVGASALALHGIPGLPARIVPEVALPRGTDRVDRAGVRVRQMDGMAVEVVRGARVASLEWALAQAVPGLPRRHGLAVLDAALRSGSLTRPALRRSHEHARGRRGVASRHVLWEWVDPRAESPLESFARLDCLDHGVPPDALQLLVRDARGRFVGRADMAWRVGSGWLIAEIDGKSVHGPEALGRDLRRQNSLLECPGVRLVRFSADDLRVPGVVAGAVRRARAQMR